MKKMRSAVSSVRESAEVAGSEGGGAPNLPHSSRPDGKSPEEEEVLSPVARTVLSVFGFGLFLFVTALVVGWCGQPVGQLLPPP